MIKIKKDTTRRTRNQSVIGNIIRISGSNNIKNTEEAENISYNWKIIYTRKGRISFSINSESVLPNEVSLTSVHFNFSGNTAVLG